MNHFRVVFLILVCCVVLEGQENQRGNTSTQAEAFLKLDFSNKDKIRLMFQDLKQNKGEIERIILQAERDVALRALGKDDLRLQIEVFGIAARAQAGSEESLKELNAIIDAKQPNLPAEPAPAVGFSPDGKPQEIAPGSNVQKKIEEQNRVVNERNIGFKRKAVALMAVCLIGRDDAAPKTLEVLKSLQQDQAGNIPLLVAGILAFEPNTGLDHVLKLLEDTQVDQSVRQHTASFMIQVTNEMLANSKVQSLEAKVASIIPKDAPERISAGIVKMVLALPAPADDPKAIFGGPEIGVLNMLASLPQSLEAKKAMDDYVIKLKGAFSKERFERVQVFLSSLKEMKKMLQPEASKVPPPVPPNF